MKLLGSIRKDVDSNKSGEIVPKLESVEVVLAHCNLVKMIISTHQNQQFGQLINIKLNSLIMMNTINTEFSHIEIWFTDQFSKPLEIEDNVNLTLIIG